ncbi:hypothetical protein AXG93_1626s1040 [Marchantia polymorpha subsp. ruderalis]|uniref:Reverse transcriptase Ty1/copia-type domain-containing protein n=1 Tax=Marchantia polymorpha subsp. ruderalis TaxID=1480154 RepID=A0A176W7N9_MARPO|nr:hypothetical protein AXG93_1626s1040 [Marchantia polymorpha subsp. ruderalis]
MLIVNKEQSEIQKLKTLLSKRFQMKDLGPAKVILGMEIERDRTQRRLGLFQKRYLTKVLERFDMSEAKPVNTPIAHHFKLSVSQCPETDEDKRFMSNPGKAHWQAVKWVLRYIRGSHDTGIIYGCNNRSSEFQVEGFVDSDYAGSLDTRRSLTGYLFTIGGGVISWKSNLQPVVTLSTTEAEYIAVTEAVKEAIWLKGLVTELGFNQKQVTIHCDNHSAIHLSKHQVFHDKSKHIDMKMHFVRDIINSGGVSIEKISTEDNPSDMLTKSVPGHKFAHCLGLINMRKKMKETCP